MPACVAQRIVELGNPAKVRIGHEGYVAVGKRIIPWMDIRRVDRMTSWGSPLLVRITLFDDSRMLLVYPGDLDSCCCLRSLPGESTSPQY